MPIRRRKKTVPEDRVYLGKIVKPHALKGEFKYKSFSGDPDLLEILDRVYVEGLDSVYQVEWVRGSIKTPIIKLEGIDTREQLTPLLGKVLWVHEDDLPTLEENYFYESDFLFARAVTESGEELGRIEQVIETGESDVLVIRDRQGHERLLPACLEVVKEVKREEQMIVVSPPAKDETNE